MQRLGLAVLLGVAWVGCNAQEASVTTAAATSESTAAPAADNSRILGTEVDAETRKDIIQLDLEQNDANSIGDSEGMIDRMLADDTLWIGATGRVVTKPQILAVTRHNFQKNPTKTKKDAAPHDDFGIRRFGDVIVQHGRSTTMKPDGTKGDARRYLIVLQKQRGQWFVIGRETIPIDYKAQPESPEILAVQARAKASPTNKIILGKEVGAGRRKRDSQAFGGPESGRRHGRQRQCDARPSVRRRHHVDELDRARPDARTSSSRV